MARGRGCPGQLPVKPPCETPVLEELWVYSLAAVNAGESTLVVRCAHRGKSTVQNWCARRTLRVYGL